MKRAWSISLFPFQQGVEVLIVQICTRFQSRLRSLKYLWFDQLPFSCWSSKILGPGTLLFKLAINSAYCIVPVHQLDRHLQGVYWWDQVFVEQAIPFGLSSVPILFIAVAGTIGRTLMETGVTLQMHYLEDYCFFPPPFGWTRYGVVFTCHGHLSWPGVRVTANKIVEKLTDYVTVHD